MDRLLTVMRVVRGAENDFGEREKALSEIGKIYARRVDVSEDDRLQSGAEPMVGMAAFVVRENTLSRGLRPQDVLTLDDQNWVIQSNLEKSGSRRGNRRILAKFVEGSSAL